MDTIYKIGIRPIESIQGQSKREGEKRAVLSLIADLLQSSQEDLHLDYLPSGRPILINTPELWVSISHTERFVAVLLSQTPAGVDIEMIGQKVLRVRDKFLSGEEQDLLKNIGEKEEQLLHLCWSAKEACFKRYNPPARVITEFQLRGIERLNESKYLFTLKRMGEVFLVQGEIYNDYVLAYSLGE